jgi:hypothetical protein
MATYEPNHGISTFTFEALFDVTNLDDDSQPTWALGQARRSSTSRSIKEILQPKAQY